MAILGLEFETEELAALHADIDENGDGSITLSEVNPRVGGVPAVGTRSRPFQIGREIHSGS